MLGAGGVPDVGTVALLMLMTTTLVLWLNWRVHSHTPAAAWWLAGKLCFVGGAALVLLRGRIPDLASVVLGNSLLVGGFLVQLVGACAFAGMAPPRRLLGALVILTVPGHAYFHYVDPSFVARWWIMGLAIAAQAAWGLAVPLRLIARRDGLAGVGVYALGTVVAALVMLAVPALLTWRETGVTSLFASSSSKTWGLAMATVILVLQAFGAVMMTAQRLQRELQRQALLDVLTGLPNRRAFDDALERALARAARSGAAVGLLLVDVDWFKRINDTRGHTEGDAVLRELAQRLLAASRRADLVARVGGEEFAMILDAPDPAALGELAERVRRGVSAQPVALAGGPLRVTVSVGVAHRVAPRPDEGRTLYRDADEALYAAKRAGRDRVAFGTGTAAGLPT
jgi:diguanylate cyclase (GGDEF)-like protein